MAPFGRLSLLILLLPALLGGLTEPLLGLGVSPAGAAVNDRIGVDDGRDVERRQRVVKRIQRALSKLGIYLGPIDGVMGPKTAEAIRVFQKSRGMKVTGEATEDLAVTMETDTKVDNLLHRLEETRMRNMESAKDALLADPRTRHLITARHADDVADPTRDAAPCFRQPSPRCLLTEAVESAKAIFKPELRDWAWGEILAAQAQAGMADDALSTARRISDPRLILIALREIAEARARANHDDEALEAAAIIPDHEKRLDAHLRIAEIQVAAGRLTAVPETIDIILADAPELPTAQLRVSYRARAAGLLGHANGTKRANAVLTDALEEARGITLKDSRAIAFRHVAVAMAELGQPERARALVRDTGLNGESTHVQIAVAAAFARQGNHDMAMQAAEAVEKPRYRAIAYSKISVELTRFGETHRAAVERALKKAQADAESIKLPFAGSYATSQSVIAALDVREPVDGKEGYDDIIRSADLIRDRSLRAYTLWAIAAKLRERRAVEAARFSEELAQEATAAVKSQLSRAWIYGDQVVENIQRGEMDQAWQAFNDGIGVAEKITNPWARARAVGKMAAALSALIDVPAAASAQRKARSTVPKRPIPNGHPPTLAPK